MGATKTSGRNFLFEVAISGMNSMLPPTGTTRLLDLLSPYIPDAFINDLFPWYQGRGRRQSFSAAQLWRLHLLSLLTPVHAFNLLVQSLPEQRAWRQFARLSNRQTIPDVRMLHQMRARMGVHGLRQINEHVLSPLLPQWPKGASENLSLALIDATDLEAACSGHKKSEPDNTPPSTLPWVPAR